MAFVSMPSIRLPAGEDASPPSDPRPRVLHIYKDYWPPIVGGAEKTIHLMCRAASDEFAPSVLVSNRRARTERECIEGVPVVKAATFGRWLSAPLTPALARWIRRLGADLIHVHLPNPTATIACLQARPAAPIVATWHSDIVRQAWALLAYRPFLDRFLRQAAVIMPTSVPYLESSAQLRRFAAKCECVPLAIDVKAMAPSAAEAAEAARLRAAKKRPAIAFVGRLRYYKGLHVLLDAMREAANAEAWIVGTGPEEARLRRQAASLQAAGRVRFLGDLDDSAMKARLLAADIYCLPAHLRAEAFGLNQVEAMACGLPVVSTDVGGVGYVNRDGESGLVVPAGDSAALAAALNRLIQDKDLRARLGEGARRRAEREFDLPVLAGRLKDVYRRTIAQSRRRRPAPAAPCKEDRIDA